MTERLGCVRSKLAWTCLKFSLLYFHSGSVKSARASKQIQLFSSSWKTAGTNDQYWLLTQAVSTLIQATQLTATQGTATQGTTTDVEKSTKLLNASGGGLEPSEHTTPKFTLTRCPPHPNPSCVYARLCQIPGCSNVSYRYRFSMWGVAHFDAKYVTVVGIDSREANV